MKKRSGLVVRIIAVIVLLAGIGVFAYPYITDFMYKRSVDSLVDEFEAEVGAEYDSLPPDSGDDSQGGGGNNAARWDALYQRLVAENITMFDNGQENLKDPFSVEQATVDLREYGIKTGIIGYIIIPRINETIPIYLGASEENLVKGVCHLTETSYPVGGENTNTVLAAHRSYPYATLFRYMDELQVDDYVYIRNFRETLRYAVVSYEIIQPDDVSKILIQPGKEMLTLFGCHPYGQSTERYVVYCERI